MRPEDLLRKRFSTLTPIQRKAFRSLDDSANFVITAPTGSGKTEAALLPALLRAEGPLSVIYVTPLRSLNRDMVERIREWAALLNLRVGVRHGDTSQRERSFQSRHPPHVLITTPETLQMLLLIPGFRKHLPGLRTVIVDELHELLPSKRGLQLSLTLARLRAYSDFKVIALSATLRNPGKAASRFLNDKWRVIEDTAARRPVIRVTYVEGKDDQMRLKALVNELSSLMKGSKTLIFTNTRYMAELLGSRLIDEGLPVAVHHGSLSKEERERVEGAYREGGIRAIVCTSSLELGIDIGDTDLVIQINSPRQVRKAVQRIGRSKHRYGESPKGYIVCTNRFEYEESRVIADMASKGDIEEDEVIPPLADVLSHSVAGMVLERGRISVDDVMDALSKTGWYKDYSRSDVVSLLDELDMYRVIRFRDDMITPGRGIHGYYYSRISTIPYERKYTLIHGKERIGSLDDSFVFTLNEGDVFITKGIPWRVVSIDEDSVRVERATSTTLAIPDWEGEQIPVSKEVAQRVMRLSRRRAHALIFGDMVIIFTYLGSRANSALATALGSYISDRLLAPITTHSSQYAIFLRSSLPIGPDMLKEALFHVDVKKEVLSTITNLRRFSRIFSQVAFYMGLTRERINPSPTFIEKTKGRWVFKEALRYFMFRYFDVDVRLPRMEVRVVDRLDDYVLQALEHLSGSQILLSDFPEAAVDRFLDNLPRTFRFKCISCGRSFYASMDNLPKVCPFCSSILIAPVDDRTKESELMQRQALYQSFGKRLLMALSTYGVGLSTAIRILNRNHKDDRSFIIDLLRARDDYFRTRKYWKL